MTGPTGGQGAAERDRAGDAAAPDPEAAARGAAAIERRRAGAVRGMGAGALGMEAVVLLLAIAPLVKLTQRLTVASVVAVVALAAICVALAGQMRRGWAWHAGTAVQVALLGYGVFHPALSVLGLIFLAVWLYVLHVRRTVLGRRP